MTDHSNQPRGSIFSNDATELQVSTDTDDLSVAASVRSTASGRVVLPAGAIIESVSADGSDLVITLDDGRVIVVPDGAIVLPQLIIGDTPIPAANLAALLVGNEPEPAAGPTQSSGGNFATDPGEIQSAFDLGDLLPYTELGRSPVEEDEIIPELLDEEPEVGIQPVDQAAAVAAAVDAVSEVGLPVRGSEPAGTDSANDAEFTTGAIVFDSPDGLESVTINGVAITEVGQIVPTAIGELRITGIEPGRIGYEYRLTDNTLDASIVDVFEVVVTDSDGDTASASLTIQILDDGPIAVDDSGSVPAGSRAPIIGNVVDNDIPGADDLPAGSAVTGFANADGSAVPGASLQGEFGALTLNGDGSYTYLRDVNTPGNVSDSFIYDVVDQDGSVSSATLVISIGNAPAVITFIPDSGPGTQVGESGLPPRTNEPAGSGEIADGNPLNNSDQSEITGATITFNSPDGVSSVTINGVTITPGSLPQTVVADGTGTLVITGYMYDPVSGEGAIDYEYTLGDNTSGDDTSVSFDIVVTDLDNQMAEGALVVDIADDNPLAVDDSATQATENASVTVDVFANDTSGADGVQFADVNLLENSLDGAGSLEYNGDGTFTYLPGPAETGDVTFSYTITDGDGDMSNATVTITLLADSTPSVSVTGDNTVDEAGLPARNGEPAGSLADGDGETASGNIVIGTGNDTLAALIINGVDVTGGGNVSSVKGDLSVTLENGVYSYSYTLRDNTLSDPDSDSFTLLVRDSDGSEASTTLVIAIADDTPFARDDAGALDAGAFGPISGNVLDNDTQGADAAAVISYTGTGGTGAVGESVQGTYGSLTITQEGVWTYARDPGTPGGFSDTFSYTIVDSDGDPSPANLVITIGDAETDLNVPVAGGDGALVLEPGLDGPPAGSAAADDGEFTTGEFFFAAPDGPATVLIDGVAVTFEGQTFAGSFGTLTVDTIADGSISYTYELTQATNGDDTFDSFTVRVEDQDDDFSQSVLRVNIVDDVPTAVADSAGVTEGGDILAGDNASVLANDEGGADGIASIVGVRAAGGDIASDVSGGVGAPIVGVYGTLTLNADGTYSYAANSDVPDDPASDVFVYTVVDGDGDLSTTTLTIDLTLVTLVGDDQDKTVFEAALDLVADDRGAAGPSLGDDLVAGSVSGSTPGSDGETVTGTLNVTGGVGTIAYTLDAGQSGQYGEIAINPDGTWSYTLRDPVDGDSLDPSQGGDNGSNLYNDIESFSYTATDENGNTTTGTITIDVTDDVPSVVTTEDAVASNAAGPAQTFSLDIIDGDIDGEYEADADGTIRFSTSLEGLTGLTSGGSAIYYHVSDDQQSLLATTSADDPFLTPLDQTDWVFRLDLNPDGDIDAANDTYDVTVYAKVDSITEVDFTSNAYDFVGGNTHWVGFVPAGQENNPENDGSSDLLITPLVDGDTANGNANEIGSGGAGGGSLAVGPNQGLLLDFVSDLLGNPTNGGGGYVSPSNHTFDGHYTVPSAAVEFSVGNANNVGTIKFVAWDDPDGNNTVGDVAVNDWDNITQVIISYGGQTPNDATDDAQFVIDTSATGAYAVSYDGSSYTLTKAADGSVTYNGIETGTVVAVFTQDGSYTTLQTSHAGGDDYTITGIGSSVITNSPVEIAVPIELVDGDGDIAESYIDILFRPLTGTQDGSASGIAVSLTATDADPNLIGSDFNDTLTGHDGNNWIAGGEGADTLSGGDGSDFFVIDPSHVTAVNDDTITDYEDGDIIDIRALISSLGSNAADATVRLFGNQLQVDVDGAGTDFGWTGIAILSNNPGSVDVLLTYGTSAQTFNVVVPPVVLDLDGDGAEYLSLTAGVAYDFAGDGRPVATAWVAPDDAILVHDANGDGTVSGASEFTFGADGATDLEAVAALFDSNGDGVLDANDPAFASFGIWQDADSDGVADPGEFQSLADAGIASIGLVATGPSHLAADGDVHIAGHASYVRADGSTGLVADAGFLTAALDRSSVRSGEYALASAVMAGFLVNSVDEGAGIGQILVRQPEDGDFDWSASLREPTVDVASDAAGNDLLVDQPTQSESGKIDGDMSVPAFENDNQPGAGEFGGSNDNAGAQPFAETAAADPAIESSAFDFGAEFVADVAMMDALLVVSAKPDGSPLATTQDLAEVEAVLADALGPDEVDALIDGIAGPEQQAGASDTTGSDQIDLAAFLQQDIGTEMAFAPPITQESMDEMAVAVTASA